QLGKEAAQPLFRPIEEQLFVAMAKIARLQNREAYVLAGDMSVPELMRTPEISRENFSTVCGEICVDYYQQKSGLALPFDEALERVLARDRALAVVGGGAEGDDHQPRRRLVKTHVVSPSSALASGH